MHPTSAQSSYLEYKPSLRLSITMNVAFNSVAGIK
jgi:hypothetical protein